jgi:hypothetical protein
VPGVWTRARQEARCISYCQVTMPFSWWNL